MSHRYLTTLGVLGLIAFGGIHSARLVSGQVADGGGGAEPRVTLDIALVDLAQVYQKNRGFQSQLAELRREVADTDQKLKVRQAEIATVDQQLKNTQAGSENHARLQLELARLQTELRVYQQQEQLRLSKREAELYAATYEEIAKATQEYSRQHAIKLVIRFSDEPMQASNREEMLKLLNRPVLFQDGLDITDEIVRLLDRRNT